MKELEGLSWEEVDDAEWEEVEYPEALRKAREENPFVDKIVVFKDHDVSDYSFDNFYNACWTQKYKEEAI